MMNITPNQLESALKKAWGTDTCYFKSIDERIPENPCIGHCTVTALIVQDYFWWDIVFCYHQDHYRNRLPNGEMIDMTKDQMLEEEVCCIDKICNRIDLLESEKAINAKTKERYLLLKKPYVYKNERISKIDNCSKNN